MDDLITTTDYVRTILEENEKARNSDNYLYYCIIRKLGKSNGIDIDKMSVTEFFLHMKDYKMPNFETVRRTRQKLQATHPELKACKEVEETRAINEDIYRAYARRKEGKNDRLFNNSKMDDYRP